MSSIAPAITMQSYLTRLSNGEIFNANDAKLAFDAIMSGECHNTQIAAFLMGLAVRGETIQEIQGAVMAMRERAVPIDAPEDAIDCCGTGGDGAHTYNISTAVSFVVAGCGVPVAKHGNRASSSKSGAADVLEALGVKLDADSTAHYKALRRYHTCFLMAQNFHPAAKYVAPVRKEMGVRTIFNLLGPLLNPAGTKRQLIGVYDQKRAEPMAQVLHNLGSEFAWLVHGADGLDEITTTDKTYVTELNNGKIESFEIHPHDVGIGIYTLDDIRGGTATENAEALSNLLNGKTGAYRDIVLLNAAAALIVAGKAEDLETGVEMARASIDEGKALAALNGLIALTNGKES